MILLLFVNQTGVLQTCFFSTFRNLCFPPSTETSFFSLPLLGRRTWTYISGGRSPPICQVPLKTPCSVHPSTFMVFSVFLLKNQSKFTLQKSVNQEFSIRNVSRDFFLKLLKKETCNLCLTNVFASVFAPHCDAGETVQYYVVQLYIIMLLYVKRFCQIGNFLQLIPTIYKIDVLSIVFFQSGNTQQRGSRFVLTENPSTTVKEGIGASQEK